MPRGNSRPPAHVPWRRPKAIPPRAPDLGLPAGVSSSRPPSCGTRDVRREQEVGYSACATRTPKGDELGFLTRATGRVRSTPRSEHRPSTQRPLCGHLPPARVRRMMRENPPPVPNRAIARLRMLQASTLGLLRSDRHAGDCPRPPPAVIPERAHDLCHRGLEGGRTVGRDLGLLSLRRVTAVSARLRTFVARAVSVPVSPNSSRPGQPDSPHA
jgi:hypothetical protein